MANSSLEFKPVQISENVTLQTPLSRLGKGPGLILLVSGNYQSRSSTDITKTLDPEPQQKWAEEGFAVVEVKVDPATLEDDFKVGVDALKKLPEAREWSTMGVIGAISTFIWNSHWLWTVYELAQTFDLGNLWKAAGIAAVVAFTGEEPSISTNSIPCLIHSTSKLVSPGSGHIYNSVKSTNFILPSHAHYSASPASVAHTRSLGFLKIHLGGPVFDLEAIWDEHTRFEFEERDVEKTMNTMVAEPYVNHVPTVRYLPPSNPLFTSQDFISPNSTSPPSSTK
jgi:carboxymethylenebutenolidase